MSFKPRFREVGIILFDAPFGRPSRAMLAPSTPLSISSCGRACSHDQGAAIAHRVATQSRKPKRDLPTATCHVYGAPPGTCQAFSVLHAAHNRAVVVQDGRQGCEGLQRFQHLQGVLDIVLGTADTLPDRAREARGPASGVEVLIFRRSNRACNEDAVKGLSLVRLSEQLVKHARSIDGRWVHNKALAPQGKLRADGVAGEHLVEVQLQLLRAHQSKVRIGVSEVPRDTRILHLEQ
eukprot:scaffold149_cov315-Pinguiococcus_pyrenoidosus.AAC.122